MLPTGVAGSAEPGLSAAQRRGSQTTRIQCFLQGLQEARNLVCPPRSGGAAKLPGYNASYKGLQEAVIEIDFK